MIHTSHFNGIKLDIQAPEIEVSEAIQERIQKMLTRLHKFHANIAYADVYLESKEGKSTHNKAVKVRLGIAGPDAFAEDSGDDFITLIGSVEDKLRSQIVKS